MFTLLGMPMSLCMYKGGAHTFYCSLLYLERFWAFRRDSMFVEPPEIAQSNNAQHAKCYSFPGGWPPPVSPAVPCVFSSSLSIIPWLGRHCPCLCFAAPLGASLSNVLAVRSLGVPCQLFPVVSPGDTRPRQWFLLRRILCYRRLLSHPSSSGARCCCGADLKRCLPGSPPAPLFFLLYATARLAVSLSLCVSVHVCRLPFRLWPPRRGCELRPVLAEGRFVLHLCPAFAASYLSPEQGKWS